MGQVVVLGLDIAKSVFQVHGVDRDGGVVVRRRLRRSRVLPFSRRSSPVGSASRRVAAGTIGLASWAHSGTMSG
jgi:hypothetical protein